MQIGGKKFDFSNIVENIMSWFVEYFKRGCSEESNHCIIDKGVSF